MLQKCLQWVFGCTCHPGSRRFADLSFLRHQASIFDSYCTRFEMRVRFLSFRNSFDKLLRISLLVTLLCVPIIFVFCSDTLSLPYDPKWGIDVDRSATSLENRRGPDPIHQLTPINPGLGSPDGRLEADGGAGNGNYHLSIPLIELPGRGIGLSLSMFYNSQIWSQLGRLQFDIDSDGDWPAPGWNIGFGKLVFPYGGMLIEPDGTRRPLSLPIYEFVDGRYTGRVTAKFTDGSGGSVECPRGSDGCNQPGHIVTVTLANGRYAEFMSKATRWVDTNVYHPQRFWDVHGNFIKIDYVLDGSGNPNPPLIDRITDTVGRVIQFHYDSRGLPVAVTGPDKNSGTRVYARFTYRWLDLRVGVPGTILNPQFFGLEGVVFPGNKTGYVFEDFTPFGIPRTVSLNRDMGVTTEFLTEQGTLQKGMMTRKSVFDYPDSSDYMGLYRKLPSYSRRTDSWVDPITGRESQATTYYSKLGGTTTITYPDGSRLKQTSTTNRNRWDYGLASSTQWLGTDGKPISTTRYTWEQGADNVPRQKEVQFVQHEIGAERRVEFRYGANNMQVIQEIYYDNVPIGQLANAPVVMRKNTAFLQWPEYLDKNFNLPFQISIDAGTEDSVYELTSFRYDTLPVQSLSPDLSPSIVNYVRNLGAFPLGPRGNLTRVVRFLSSDSGPIVVLPNPSDGGPTPGLSLASHPITEYEYDETGNLRKVQPAGVQSATDYTFDAQTQYSLPTEVSVGSTNPRSDVRIRQNTIWDVGLGLPKIITDADGNDTTLTYEPAASGWRLRASRSPTGVVTRYNYDDAHLRLGVLQLRYLFAGTSEEGEEVYRPVTHQDVSFRYDGRGLLRETRARRLEGGGEYVARYEFDTMGRLKTEELPLLKFPGERFKRPPRLQYSYDPAGRLSSRTEPDGSTMRWFHNDVSKVIPAVPSGVLGETVQTKDPWSRETWKRFDLFGRIRFVIEPNAQTGKVTDRGGQLTEYQRDVLGRVIQIRQGTQVRSFRYDTLGRVTAAKYPERMSTLNDSGIFVGTSGTWSDVFQYDNRSNLVSHIDARGVRTSWEYGGDPLNRLQSIAYDTTGVGDTSNPVDPSPSVTVTYVPSGDLRRVRSVSANGVHREHREYNSFGRLLRLNTDYLRFQGVVLTSEYTYDFLNRLQTMRYPGLYENGTATGIRELTYRYSNDGDLKELDLNGNPLVRLAEYDVQGLRQLNLSLGAATITESYEYSRNSLIAKQTVTEVGMGRKLLDLEYGYVPIQKNAPKFGTGQITVQNDLLNPSTRQLFRYDALGRLTEAQTGREPLTRQIYTYDPHGNLTDVNAAELGSSNRWIPLPPQQADGGSLTIDPATNRISSPGYRYDASGNLTQAPSSSGQFQRYFYDAAGRLVRVESSTGALIEAYQYGVDRRRIGVSSNLRDWRLSFWDGYTELARYDKPESGGLTWREMPIYFGGRLLGDMNRNQKGVRFFHPDQRGTALITGLAGVGGLESTRLSALPFGKQITPAVSPVETPIFTSYERGETTGLDYAINRYYDPKQCRFVQPDPLGMATMKEGDPQSLNLYSYVMNDPVNYVDPTGLLPEKGTCVKNKDGTKTCTRCDGSSFTAGKMETVVMAPCPLTPPAPMGFDSWYSAVPGRLSDRGREVIKKAVCAAQKGVRSYLTPVSETLKTAQTAGVKLPNLPVALGDRKSLFGAIGIGTMVIGGYVSVARHVSLSTGQDTISLSYGYGLPFQEGNEGKWIAGGIVGIGSSSMVSVSKMNLVPGNSFKQSTEIYVLGPINYEVSKYTDAAGAGIMGLGLFGLDTKTTVYQTPALDCQ